MKMIRTSAEFSECGKYRYTLTRVWDDALPWVIWAMLNPSTADAEKDDPTIRRCIGFSQRYGYGGLCVVNLFAVRTPNPRLLYNADDPVGPDNHSAWQKVLDDSRAQANPYDPTEDPTVFCAWGTHGNYMAQDETALGWIWMGLGAPVCLGRTKGGFPKHPLYLKNDLQPSPYVGT